MTLPPEPYDDDVDLRRDFEDLESFTLRARAELSEQVADLDEQVADLTKAMGRLVDKVDWLERQVRSSSSVAEVRLDDVDQGIRDLAATAEKGRVLAAELVTEDEREDHQRVIDRYERLAAQCNAETANALQASAILVVTEFGEDEHTEATAAFRDAYEARAEALGKRDELQDAVAGARRALATDKSLRTDHEPRIATGHEAAETLLIRLRSVITAAVGRAALLPVWFTTALGPTAPANDTDNWLNTATEVLAYRITYGVDDALVALGGRPPSSAPRHRLEWHEQLAKALR